MRRGALSGYETVRYNLLAMKHAVIIYWSAMIGRSSLKFLNCPGVWRMARRIGARSARWSVWPGSGLRRPAGLDGRFPRRAGG